MPRKNPTKQSYMSKMSTKLLGVDKFKDTFKMPFAKGMASLPSHIGMIATIVLVTVVALYAITIITLFTQTRKATTTAAVFEKFFKDEDTFGAEQNLNIAVGLSGVAG